MIKSLWVSLLASLHSFGNIIADIRHLLATHPGYRISHVFREANQCADVMAKMGSCNDIRLCIWEEPPREVALSLLADALSVSFLRE
ncbi:ribonuclease H [Senna tora]|uniref:Ribonuclease H n=1 Tax=Senna tora TaxID=362788 RepID=A0A834WS54_9FABA|nr:ribonuclease H [Senna tora]